MRLYSQVCMLPNTRYVLAKLRLNAALLTNDDSQTSYTVGNIVILNYLVLTPYRTSPKN